MSESRIPIRFAIIGLVCFIMSLNMPTLKSFGTDNHVHVIASTLDGLQTAIFAFKSIYAFDRVSEYSVFSLIGMCQISFIVTPLAIWGRVNKKLLLSLQVLVLVGLSSGLYAYIQFNNHVSIGALTLAVLGFKFIYGFYLWLIGYLLLAIAISFRLLESGRNPGG